MTRFRDLLTYDPASTPGDEQRRASEGLADAVARSRLRWWKGSKVASSQGKCILLVVAPFSQYDLTLLDLLDERLHTNQPPVPVYVANLQDYATAEQLSADFPGIGAAPQTPIVAICDSGLPQTVACGKKARDMAAQALGLSADELSRRIIAESPSYVNSTAERVAPLRPLDTTMKKAANMNAETFAKAFLKKMQQVDPGIFNDNRTEWTNTVTRQLIDIGKEAGYYVRGKDTRTVKAEKGPPAEEWEPKEGEMRSIDVSYLSHNPKDYTDRPKKKRRDLWRPLAVIDHECSGKLTEARKDFHKVCLFAVPLRVFIGYDRRNVETRKKELTDFYSQVELRQIPRGETLLILSRKPPKKGDEWLMWICREDQPWEKFTPTEAAL